jgi:hypothetical protein
MGCRAVEQLSSPCDWWNMARRAKKSTKAKPVFMSNEGQVEKSVGDVLAVVVVVV